MLTILWSCGMCGLIKQKAFVRWRRDDEDICDWMKEATQQVSDAHNLASLGCTHDRVDLMIPMGDDPKKGIGCK